MIYTTNWLERNNKEFRKRLRPMNSIPSIHAAEKVFYFKAVEINTRWSQRRLKGFAEAKAELIRMFEACYPSGWRWNDRSKNLARVQASHSRRTPLTEPFRYRKQLPGRIRLPCPVPLDALSDLHKLLDTTRHTESKIDKMVRTSLRDTKYDRQKD